MRVIQGLTFAEPCGKPGFIGTPRPRGAKAAGLKYERALASALPAAKHGQWFAYADRGGLGWCQPDLLLETQFGLAVLEAKYTFTEQAFLQVERLYKPVLTLAYSRQVVFGFQVCKTLTPGARACYIADNLDEAIGVAASGRKVALHWLGQGLGPLRQSRSPIPLASSLAQL